MKQNLNGLRVATHEIRYGREVRLFAHCKRHKLKVSLAKVGNGAARGDATIVGIEK
jgi:hypothetical protein